MSYGTLGKMMKRKTCVGMKVSTMALAARRYADSNDCKLSYMPCTRTHHIGTCSGAYSAFLEPVPWGIIRPTISSSSIPWTDRMITFYTRKILRYLLALLLPRRSSRHYLPSRRKWLHPFSRPACSNRESPRPEGIDTCHALGV